MLDRIPIGTLRLAASGIADWNTSSSGRATMLCTIAGLYTTMSMHLMPLLNFIYAILELLIK
jgi:hypothetical protein